MNRFAPPGSCGRMWPAPAARLLAGCLLALVGTLGEALGDARSEATTSNPPAASRAEIDALLAQLSDPSVTRRREALLRLTDHDAGAEAVLSHVWPLLQDPDLIVRAQAARAVWLVGQRADAAVVTLNSLLDPLQPQACALASFLVGEIGPPARDALPALRARMTEADPLLRLYAAEAIAKIDPTDAAAHTALILALRDPSADVRYFSACALLTAGARYRDQVRGALLAALSDGDLRVASAAALSLEHWPAAPPVPEHAATDEDLASLPHLNKIVATLSDPDAAVRRTAALRLVELEDAAAAAAKALRQRLADEDPVVRAYAAYALWQIDRRSTSALPTLIDLLGTTNPNVTTLATSVLARLGPAAADALPTLYDLLERNDPLVQLHVAMAISRIDPRGRDAVSVLSAAVDSSDSDVRYLAALSLGHVSLPLRKIAERRLMAAVRDRNLRVRSAATLALDNLHTALAQARIEAQAAVERAQIPRSENDEGNADVAPEIPEETAIEDAEGSDTEVAVAADPEETATIPALGEQAAPEDRPQPNPAPQHHSSEFDLDDVTIEEKKSIGQLRARIVPPDGDLPVDHAGPLFAKDQALYHGYGTVRGWYATPFAWESPCICHAPLWFQDLNLERYGYHFGCGQTLVSSVKFFADAALLPYKVCAESPHDCVYTLGYDRPGNCVPYRCYRMPWRTDAAMVLGGVAVGLFFLAPP